MDTSVIFYFDRLLRKLSILLHIVQMTVSPDCNSLQEALVTTILFHCIIKGEITCHTNGALNVGDVTK